MAKVQWRKSAEDNHIARATGIAFTYGTLALKNYLEDIDEACKRLELFPLSGSATPGSNLFLRKTASTNGYTLIYEVDDLQHPTTVLVVAIGKGI